MTPGRRIVERGGWRLIILDEDRCTDALIEATLALLGGMGGQSPLRRSRHATTFEIKAADFGGRASVFVKILDNPGRLGNLKNRFRGARSARLERVTAAMTTGGFSVPKVLIRGQERRTGREMAAVTLMEGDGPLRTLARIDSVIAKRALLRALGVKVARLHRAGFIHGDLTPFNLRIVRGEPPRFGFIDNERSRRVIIGRGRQRLRNLVQLGRFVLPGITRSDRLRVFDAYERTLYGRRTRRLTRQANDLLVHRIRRDLAI